MPIFETEFKKKSFDMLQKALLASGARVILPQPDWDDLENVTTEQYILLESLCEIGNMYHKLVPYEF